MNQNFNPSRSHNSQALQTRDTGPGIAMLWWLAAAMLLMVLLEGDGLFLLRRGAPA